MMTPEDKAALVGLYEERYARLGHDLHTLGWNTPEDQHLRFQVLADAGTMAGDRVCDVGCGFGDLLPYLRSRFGAVDYLGVDLSPSLVQKAAELHPDARFRCTDILADGFEERCDWFLLSGALNFRIADNLGFSKRMIERMFALADKGIAVNFLTSYVNFQREHNYHHDPLVLFDFAKQLTRWVTLRHDYPLWEFTLYLYKEPQQ